MNGKAPSGERTPQTTLSHKRHTSRAHIERTQQSGEEYDIVPRTATVQIFWPRTLVCPPDGALFGWCVSGGPQEVVIVIAGAASRAQCDRACLLPIFSATLPREASTETTACVIGGMSSGSGTDHQKASLWVGVEEGGSAIDRIRIPDTTKGRTLQCTINIFHYSIPEPESLQFLSLEPILLPRASTYEGLERQSQVCERTELHRRLETLIQSDPTRTYELTRSQQCSGPGAGFRRAIALINRAKYLKEKVGGDRKRSQDYPSSPKLVHLGFLASPINLVRSSLDFTLGIIALREVSSAARQAHLRLGQATHWPILARRIRIQRRSEQLPVSALSPQYIGLWNGVWLVANDIILGQAVGAWLCDNDAVIGRVFAKFLRQITVALLLETLDWLGHWPVGLKLNTELATFFGDLYSGLTQVWASNLVAPLETSDGALLARLVHLLGMSGRLFGLTFLLSLASDLAAVLTAHISLFYRISRSIYTFFNSTITALFYLFRGKKRNPLRSGRTDEATYDLDQLLLGTLFFTLLAFLWPTVAVYYLFLSLARLVVVAVEILLETALALLNHLPLFALMLRVKDGKRLPGGVKLSIRWPANKHSKQQTSSSLQHQEQQRQHFDMDNVPLSPSSIFRGYGDHLQGLRALPRLCLAVLTGDLIACPTYF